MSAPLWNRLRERKLLQWGVAYVAGAWLLLQVFDVVGDKFDWPATVFRTTTALLVVGLLAALVLAWFHGEKGEQKVRGIELLMLAVLCVLAAAAVAFVSVQYDWDYAAAEGDARAAVELNPNDPTAHQSYGQTLLVTGRIEESGKEYGRAAELDPLALPSLFTYPYWARLARRYNEAIAGFERILRIEPDYAIALYWSGFAYMSASRFAEAARVWRRWAEVSGQRDPAEMEAVVAGWPDPAGAGSALEVLARWEASPTCPPYELACHYAQLRRPERALDVLERGVRERASMMPYIRVEPLLDPLRSDPRYTAIARKVGLE